MPGHRITAIRIRKGDTVFHTHGDLAGTEGVYSAKGQVHGLYEAPVKTTYRTGAFQEGSRYRHAKRLHRDLTLGFHIKGTFHEYELNDSLFRQLFEYEDDLWDQDPDPTTIEVQTDLSDVRKLDVMMFEEPEFDPDLDPISQQFGNVIFKLRAAKPDWYEDDVITVFDGTATTGYGTITVSNPTDRVMYQKWILTRGTWTLPDFQWVGPKGDRTPGGPNHDRTISGIVVTEVNGGAVVDLDPQELMFRDANNTNILGQLSGKYFNYAIPPYTPETELPVQYIDAPSGGAMAQLVQPRRWSRPWGLELPSTVTPTPHVPTLTIVPTVGPYSYKIPPFCDTIAVVLLPGGGGGDNGWWFEPGAGGLPGQFVTAILERGIDIPWETTKITGVIGAGGAAGGGDGGDTTATATGMTPLSATGALGGAADGWVGASPGVVTVAGRNYEGGKATAGAAQPGNPPGGGGAGGYIWYPGAVGGRGQAWFYAYQNQEPGSDGGSIGGSI